MHALTRSADRSSPRAGWLQAPPTLRDGELAQPCEAIWPCWRGPPRRYLEGGRAVSTKQVLGTFCRELVAMPEGAGSTTEGIAQEATILT